MKTIRAIISATLALVLLISSAAFAVAEENAFASYSFEDWENEDFSGKETSMYLGWIEGKSFGGMNNPDNTYGYVTSMIRVFLYLYSDGSLQGYYIDNTGSSSPETSYDLENRLHLKYYGTWSREGDDVTVSFLICSNEPKDHYITQSFTFEGETAYFDFDFLGNSEAEGEWSFLRYTLVTDGTIPEETADELVDSINYDMDEELAG